MIIEKIPSIYIVILNYNGYEDTSKCIKSLKKISNTLFDIIIVDNNSTDNSLELLKEDFPGIIYLKSEVNLGYAGGMNLGIKYALDKNAEFILLSNNDIIFEENFLEPLLSTFEIDQNIGVVSPKVMYMHNKELIYCAGGEFKLFLCCGINKYQGKLDSEFGNNIGIISHAEGSCLLVKGEVFKKIGLLNEKYFMYFEDLDFSQRVRKQYKLFYNPKSKVFHKTGAGLSWRDYTPLYYYYYTRNRLLFTSGYNIFYKFYSLIFTFINSIAKSIILFWPYIIKKNINAYNGVAIKNLWKGTFEGTKIIINSILK